MISNYELYQIINESWTWTDCVLYVHKLKSCGKITNRYLETLVQEGVLKNTKDVYIYSSMNPNIEHVISMTTSLSPERMTTDTPAWYSYINPVKPMFDRGMQGAGFSQEKIPDKNFSTSSFLGSGEKVTFSKVAEFPTQVITTAIPLPLVLAVMVYENIQYRFTADSNAPFKSLKFKKWTAWTLFQIAGRTNYIYKYKTKVEK